MWLEVTVQNLILWVSGQSAYQPRKCLFRTFLGVTSEISKRKVFVNMNLILLAACTKSSVDSFPYKQM